MDMGTPLRTSDLTAGTPSFGPIRQVDALALIRAEVGVGAAPVETAEAPAENHPGPLPGQLSATVHPVPLLEDLAEGLQGAGCSFSGRASSSTGGLYSPLSSG